MKKLWNLIKSNFYPLLLIALGVFLCSRNYTPNTILSGWDTLHPEFNFSLAFQRMLNGVWRSDQGLGIIAIQSHMADLPRVCFLWLLSIIGAPVPFLRYSYIFLMLIIGPVGVYFLTKKILDSCRSSSRTLLRSRNDKNGYAASFLAGLAYLCNLGTLQHFIVPLEMFATLYGLFPWLIITVIYLIDKPSKKYIVIFFLLSLFASSMAHTATLWYAYAVCMLLFVALYTVLQKKLAHAVKLFILIVFLLISSNAYWILPNIYTMITKGQETRESKVNQLFSPEAFAKNQAFGTIDNAVLLKNFLFDWNIYNPKEGQFEDLMAVWKQHLAIPYTVYIGYLIFSFSLVGIVVLCWKRNRMGLALLPVYVIGFLMLLSGTPPVTTVFTKIQELAPVAGEALRFPFTKFSILYMVPFAVFVGVGVQQLLIMAKTPVLRGIATVEMALALIAFFLPAFTGNLIHPAMRIQIPTAYADMFSWFQTQAKTDRVAILPIHTFWNWTYYDWGYQGAGFLQFGIQQPILDRDYDRWSVYNETYQKEMSYAIYSQEPDLIRSVFTKYDVRWVLVDASVIAPGENKNMTFTWRLPDLLEQSGAKKVKQFGSSIAVYDTGISTADDIQSLPLVNTSLKTLGLDTTFRAIGPYISSQPYSVTKEERVDRFIETPETTLITEQDVYSASQTETFSIPFPQLSHDQAYLITIESKNAGGFPMQLCIANDLTKHCEVFTRLHWGNTVQKEQFLLLPYTDYGMGYTLNFKNDTVGKQKAKNDLVSVRVATALLPTNAPNGTSSADTYVFAQSYDKGWHAYTMNTNLLIYKSTNLQIQEKLFEMFPFVFGTEIKEHVMVNNWEIGWILPEAGISNLQINKSTNQCNNETMQQCNNEIVLFFLPQLLQWIGFAMLPLSFLFLLLKRNL